MKLTASTAGREYTVAPVPELDPQFTVTLVELSDGEMNSIYDEFKYIPGTPKATMSKLAKVVRKLIVKSVRKVTNATDGNGNALDETADATKLMLYETEVEIDGDRKTLWMLTQEKVAAEKAEAAKN